MEWKKTCAEIETLLYNQRKCNPKNLVHKNTYLMIKLYQRINDEPSKEGFLAYLRSKISDGEFEGLEYFLLEFLIKVHRIDQILTHWTEFDDNVALSKLAFLVRSELDYFSLQDLDKIRDRIRNDLDRVDSSSSTTNTKKSIYDLIMAIKHDSLCQQLIERENPEINFDVERVQQEIDYFGFPKPLSVLLSEIESLYEKAATEKEYSDVAEKVRKLLDQLLIQVSDEVSHLQDIPITKGHDPRPFARRNFLHEKGLISKEEKKLLDSIYFFASAEGTHSLKSSAERTRICKNIVIEVILYLLRRLHEFEEEVSASV